MSDGAVVAIVVAALVVHLVLPLVCLWARRGFAPLLACNGVMAALILAAIAPGLPRAFGDGQVMALAGFEVLVLAAALWASRRRGWPRARVVWGIRPPSLRQRRRRAVPNDIPDHAADLKKQLRWVSSMDGQALRSYSR